LSATFANKDPFDYIAADFNQGGLVTLQIALEILKYALGLIDLETEWKFVDANRCCSDIAKSNMVFEKGVCVEVMSTSIEVTMMGVLFGVVNDGYTTFLDMT
jgi:hypothetical protein